MGIKLFIINYFYTTYPRLNQKYNSTHILWQSLPTQAQWEKQHAKSQIDKVSKYYYYFDIETEKDNDFILLICCNCCFFSFSILMHMVRTFDNNDHRLNKYEMGI